MLKRCKICILILLLLCSAVMVCGLTACSNIHATEPSTQAIPDHSNNRNADTDIIEADEIETTEEQFQKYIGKEFIGDDPWGGTITIKVKKIKNNDLNCIYKDVIDDYTIYVDLCDIELENGIATFGITGVTLEDDTVRFNYVGTLELIDDAIILHYMSGDLFIGSAQSGSYYYHIGALDEESKIVTLKSK